jgi:hypothetical protein
MPVRRKNLEGGWAHHVRKNILPRVMGPVLSRFSSCDFRARPRRGLLLRANHPYGG